MLLRCQPDRSFLPVLYTATGTYSRHFTDAFSGAVNQAALAQVQQATAGVYAEKRFMLTALSSYTAALAWPVKNGGIGISLQYAGDDNYNTSQAGIGYGKKLGDAVDIGIQVNYNAVRLAGYGSSSALAAAAGILLHITDKLHTGLHVYNFTGAKFGRRTNEPLAAVYSTGIGYELSDKFFIGIDISKKAGGPVAINAGMQYVVADHLFARLCTAAGTGSYIAGLGVQWKTFRVDAVTGWHAQLGFTPGLLLLFTFKEPPQPPEN